MAEQTLSLVERINARFGGKVLASALLRDHVVVDVAPEHWVEVARGLRDDAEFRFEQLIDVCGVDYLGYGQDEWATETVTATGFSHGVEGQAMDSFS
jgi:NADH-quinone oxidoreductase subunit C